MAPEFDLESYQNQVAQEIKDEADKDNPVQQRLRKVSFISHSNGRGRGKRKAREVDLLVVDDMYAHLISRGEIRRRRNRDYVEIDVLANEILNFLPLEERTPDRLLEMLSKNHR